MGFLNPKMYLMHDWKCKYQGQNACRKLIMKKQKQSTRSN